MGGGSAQIAFEVRVCVRACERARRLLISPLNPSLFGKGREGGADMGLATVYDAIHTSINRNGGLVVVTVGGC